MSGQYAHAYLGIGEVLVELRGEFPDISVSKIRFLESEGLITPARSPSGYRRFASGDVERLRFILTAQRDKYLPLRVIREQLARAEQQAGHSGPGQAAPATAADPISRRELLDQAGIGDEQLAELEAHGLVRRSGRLYGQDAVRVAATVGELASYGVQARHLRSVRTAAEHQVSLIEQVVAPTLRQRSPQARQAARRTAGQIAALLARLQAALIESVLAEAGLPPGKLPPAEPASDAGRRAVDRRTVGGASA